MSSRTAITGATPAAIGSAAHHQVRFAVIRRPAVRTATAYISATKPSSAGSERTTQPMSTETAASWTAARSPARTISRERPSEATPATTAAAASSRARTTPSVMLTGSSTRPP